MKIDIVIIICLSEIIWDTSLHERKHGSFALAYYVSLDLSIDTYLGIGDNHDVSAEIMAKMMIID